MRKAIILFSILALTACGAGSQLQIDPRIDRLIGEAEADEEAHRLDDAERKLTTVIEKSESSGALNVSLMRSLNRTAKFYMEHGKQEKSQKLYRRSRDIGDELSAADSKEKSEEFYRQYVIALHGLANCERDLGGLRLAMSLYKKAMEVRKSLKTDSETGKALERDLEEARRQQSVQEQVEQTMATGKARIGDRKESKKAKKAYTQELNALRSELGFTEHAKLMKRWLELVDFARTRYGTQDKRYREPIEGVMSVCLVTGDFGPIEKINREDFEPFAKLNETIEKGQPIDQSDFADVRTVIEVMVRMSDVCLGKGDVDCVERLVPRALKLIDTCDSGNSYERARCLSQLACAKRFEGEQDQARHLQEELIALTRDDFKDRARYIETVGEIDLEEGNVNGTLSTINRILALPTSDKVSLGHSRMLALQLMTALHEMYGNFSQAQETATRGRAIAESDAYLLGQWSALWTFAGIRIDLEAGNFRQAANTLSAMRSKKELLPLPWICAADQLCFAHHKLGENEKAVALIKEIDSFAPGKTPIAQNIFLSQIVKTSLSRSDREKLKSEVDRLLDLWNDLNVPAKYMRVEFLNDLASELSADEKHAEAERVFKAILKFYQSVPNRTDATLVDALENYHKSLVRFKPQFDKSKAQREAAKRQAEATLVRNLLAEKKAQLKKERAVVAKALANLSL